MPDTPDEPNNTMPDWYDPFGEPHTLPGGWDEAGWTSKQESEQKASPEPNKRRHPHELFYRFALSAN